MQLEQLHYNQHSCLYCNWQRSCQHCRHVIQIWIKTNKALSFIKQLLNCKYVTCFQHKQGLRPSQKTPRGRCNGDDISSNSNAFFYDQKVRGVKTTRQGFLWENVFHCWSVSMYTHRYKIAGGSKHISVYQLKHYFNLSIFLVCVSPINSSASILCQLIESPLHGFRLGLSSLAY